MKSHRQQNKKNNSISWPELYFTASATKETFEDVKVITLKSHVSEQAYEEVLQLDGFSNDNDMRNKVIATINSKSIGCSEHVEVRENGIRVVIDRDSIDDDVCWEALEMVAEALDQLNGEFGKIEFSSPITYQATDIPWLTIH